MVGWLGGGDGFMFILVYSLPGSVVVVVVVVVNLTCLALGCWNDMMVAMGVDNS